MNKNALMNYALWARKELENQISLSLNRLGFYKTGNKKANIVGDYTIIEGTEETFPKAVYSLRNTIFERHILENGFDETVEEFAYTWFNRIIALRFMEVHDYFNHGFRVLTSRDGSYEPEILQNVDYVIDDLKLDAHVVHTLKEQGKEEDLYRYILFSQCNSLSNVLPMLFDTQEAYMELLLPGNLLSQDSVIRHITDIPEEDFKNDVEVIGWLYQFYNSVKKDEVYASKKIVTKDTLPAVTQLFTPDWIVRYMAQNSVGRIWLESHPNSPLRQEMKYYVEDAPQDPETQKKLDEIKYKNLKLENLTIIEPCCGSGHILVYVFDLLFEMYQEEGYLVKDIPSKILSHNLFGLDVDRRAAQLSQFALVMKARSIDSRFFNKDRYVCPHVYELQDSKILSRFDLDRDMRDFGFSPKAKEVTKYLVETFQEGKTIGSLLKVKPDHYLDVANELEGINADYIANIIQQDFQRNGIPRIIYLCKLANVLSSNYDVMITNPPYIGPSTMEPAVKNYASKYYPNSRTDMFAMFMQTDFVKKNGFTAMINMQSWMFLSSFEKLRKHLLQISFIVSLLHLGPHAFDSINGEVVQTVTFVIRASKVNCQSTFYRLVSGISEINKETDFLAKKTVYFSGASDFEKIPGSPIAYWLTRHEVDAFNFPNVSKLYIVRNGISCGDNLKYLRLWPEVSSENSYWKPCNKGGSYRKWYGNNDYLIYWKDNGRSIKTSLDEHGRIKARLGGIEHSFEKGIEMSRITCGSFGFRYSEGGFIYESSTNDIFLHESTDNLFEILGFFNSIVASTFLLTLNPTINIMPEDIRKLPVAPFPNSTNISDRVQECIKISKNDWDSLETSWDFVKNPLLDGKETLESSYIAYKEQCNSNFARLKLNEEALNRIFIDIYGLNDELKPEESKADVTVHYVADSKEEAPSDLQNSPYLFTKRDVVKQFVSYAVGCMMGRYSLDMDGLAYAGGKWDTEKYKTIIPDADGVLPIGEVGYFKDEIAELFIVFVKKVFGDKNLEENLDFIAKSLGGTGSSRDIIRDYFRNQFYADHVKTYQKRPIYWMLNSGKYHAFQCLFYLHRYTPNTLAIINTKYFLPRTAQFKAERERLETQLAVHELDQRAKRNLEKRLDEVKACQQELFEYGQVLDHLANQYIELNLDDGVKVNYEKFQHVSVEMDGRTVTKNLLVPLK